MFDFLSAIELRDPWFLLLLLAAPLVYRLSRSKSAAVDYSAVGWISSAPQTWRQRLRIIPPLLFTLAFCSLCIALARPRTPQRETRVARDGIAIMMVVDLSSSMNARDLVEGDYSTDRLQVVKQVFSEFVRGTEESDGRADDLIGLVTFAGYADSVCPLTLDHDNLLSIVSDLQIVTERSEDGTAVGDGLGLAVERLRRSKAKSRVVILLTDGVNNAGVLSPQRAATLAAEFDIRCYSIGAGTNGLAPVPLQDPFGRTQLVRQQVQIDEEMLTEVARRTNGQYFRAENREGLQDIYAEIDQLEKTEVTETRYLRYTEHFRYFVAAGLIGITLAALGAASFFRTLP